MSYSSQPLILERLGPGCFFLQAPSISLQMLCGCPPDAIKLLRAKGHVRSTTLEGSYAETGPNAILLSDRRVQGREISNLTEFPVLQMLYKQGLAIPGHPNHQKCRPFLVGKQEQLDGQSEYLKRGNYGLYDLEEYQDLQYPDDQARMHLDLKRQFAYGKFLETSDLMDLKPFDEPTVHIDQLKLTRLSENNFRAELDGFQVEFSLNLGLEEAYQTSFQVPSKTVVLPSFGVLHLGDGDGWDIERPCLNTLVVAKGEKYLIDAGPFVSKNLQALGIIPTELTGLCVTHVHDDHFGGFYNLIDRHPQIQIFASPRVFASLVKKYSALTGIKEATLRERLNFQPLSPHCWNKTGALEIKTVPSAHPIDTTLMLFQMKGPDGYKCYGHLADIISLSSLKRLVKNCSEPDASMTMYQRLLEVYQMPMDLKKVDIGGEPIHGVVEDFAQDPSKVLLLSHTSCPLKPENIPFGRQPNFGDLDTLIP